MNIIADLHVHSRYARACSKNLTLKTLEEYARIKGISVLGTGDFQHPEWQKELKKGLKEDGSGILRTETGFPFLLQTEISNMYTQDGKGRRIHSLILAPDFDAVDQITEALGSKGRLDYDGRPIFGFSCIELVEMMQGINKHIEVIPAHAWTPYFGIFGSKTGFDSLKHCFQEKAKFVHAIETGLSSDPPMNWRVSSLDRIQLVSFSDLHSYWPHRMGREVTIFNLEELTYPGILNAIRTGKGLSETLEVDPAYGKYHWDGHRNCGVVLSPSDSVKNHKRCPSCGLPLTIGVEHRVEELADRPPGTRSPTRKPFKRLIPLSEILAGMMGTQPFSRKVTEAYNTIVKRFGNEFAVLLKAQKKDLDGVMDKKISRALLAVREGKIEVKPGYDGVYGEPVFEGMKQPRKRAVVSREPIKQRSLGDFSPLPPQDGA